MTTERSFSRRELLRRAGLAGTAAMIPGPLAAAVPGGDEPQGSAASAAAPPPATQAREAFETLTAAQSDALEAFVDRLVPEDASGPGARQARAAHYIDRALAGALATSRPAYVSGLAALDAHALSTKGAVFARLAPADQDVVLRALEANAATGFTPDASAFFALVRAHTIEGMFSDPYYGGNAGFVGWDLIRYPGVRIAVGASEQQLQPESPNHKSAYDFDMFAKRVAGGTAPAQDHEHGN